MDRSDRGGGQVDREFAAVAGPAVDLDAGAEQGAVAAGEGQADAGALEVAGGGVVELAEAGEEAGEVGGGDADAGVGDGDR